ncbi:hypothetical protein MNB_SUP05-SYMBIONT-5-64 [hydrothermal vent metagenome]|uniref:Uncharacterized protein n=1 Tax=hydrothermal vent metagenome TaxID=652676 RepID=A0A1W1E263_9ZZZZ
MTTKYKMGGEISKETLDLQNSKIKKITEYIKKYTEDAPSASCKCNGDDEMLIKVRNAADNYAMSGNHKCDFNEKITRFFA